MKLNWKPSKVAFLDFETQSECNLRETTASVYAKHSTTRVLTCAVSVDGTMHRLGPYLDADAKAFLCNIAAERTLVAHNAPFDAMVWEHAEGLPQATWFDTLPCCRAAGLPGGLDAVSKLVYLEKHPGATPEELAKEAGKMKAGTQLIQLLCVIRNGRVPAPGPVHGLLMNYNVKDVELLEALYERVHTYVEPEVMTVDRVINDRGVPVDRDYITQLAQLLEENSRVAGDKFDAITGGVSAGSPKQVKEWMKRLGFSPIVVEQSESVSKQAMQQLMSDPDSQWSGSSDDEFEVAVETLREAFSYRNEIVKVGKGKAAAALKALEHDGRVRDQFVYWKAHTGRWGGRGLQLHNMPVAVQSLDLHSVPLTHADAVAAAQRASASLGRSVPTADVLNAMLRHMVRGENFLVADYAAVEARGVAWVSGETTMLELYSDPHKSVYLDMGRQVYGRTLSKKTEPEEYTIAKTLVLGCGYGMSGKKFEMGCKSKGVSLETLTRNGLTCGDAVRLYRKAYPNIKKMWVELGTNALKCVDHGTTFNVAKCQMRRVKNVAGGNDMHVELPSGRILVFRNVRIEQRVPMWQRMYNVEPKPEDTVMYDFPRGYRTDLHGPKLMENIVSGICRDFTAAALVHAEQLGMRPFLHVHDEVAVEAGPDRFREFMEMVSAPPSWAPDFPILAEGYCGPVWTKQPPEGYTQLAAMSGRVL